MSAVELKCPACGGELERHYDPWDHIFDDTSYKCADCQKLWTLQNVEANHGRKD